MNKEKDLADFKRLISKLEAEGREFSKEGDVLMGIVSPEKFPYKTRSIIQDIVNIIDDNPEFSKMIPERLKYLFSGYILPESEVKISKAKKIISMIETWIKVYHGTSEDSIKGNSNTGAIYFSDSPEIAKFYSESPITGKVGRMYSLYINIENPYYAEGSQFIENAGYHPEILEPLKRKGYDGIIFYNKKMGYTEYLIWSEKQMKSIEIFTV